jgi:hypothetical protein
VAGAGDATEHEEAYVVRVDSSRAIYCLGGLVVVVKGLTHEVNVLCEGLLARALLDSLSSSERERAIQRPSKSSQRMSQAAVAQPGRAA